MGLTWGVFLGWKPLLLIGIAFIALFSIAFPEQAKWIAEHLWNFIANLF